MAKYAVSKEGTAGPYLAIEEEDIETTETLLKSLGILHCKSSDVKEGINGRIIFRIINIDSRSIAELDTARQKVFP